MPARPAWTEERVQTLSKLWLEGGSASEIARTLADGATRNAVIGKVHRLGLGGRERASVPPGRRSARRAAPPLLVPLTYAKASPVRRPHPAPEARRERDELCGLATILTVSTHACRWPIGDPSAADFALCGRAAVRGAYCAEHGVVAFRPADKQLRPDRLVRLASLR